MRIDLRIACGALLAMLAGCGGGSGGVETPTPPAVVDLGLVAATGVTRRVLETDSPLSSAATVTVGSLSGPFTLDPADVPASVAGSGHLSVGILCAPTGPDPLVGAVTLRFTPPRGSAQELSYELHALPEAVTLSLLTPTLAFGEVLEGKTRQLAVGIRNDSTLSIAAISTSTPLPAGFVLVPGALPVSIAPGTTADVSVLCLPTGVGTAGGMWTLGAGEPGGPLSVTLSSTTGGEVITDFGTQALDGSLRTPVLSVEVPADAISLSLEGVMSGANVGLAEWTGPGGRVYENLSGTGAYLWLPADVFTAGVPNTDRAPLQLVAGGGTYTFRLYRFSGSGSQVSVRAIVERRPGGTGAVGRLDLDVWLANVISPKAATAATDARLQSVLVAIDQILGTVGLRVGDIRYHDVPDPTYDDVTNAEFGPMLKLTASAASPRLNLFFVRTALGGGVLGVAATIAGPKRNGTQLSGVMSLYDGYPAATIGLVAAHEIGHFLGLYHTVEQDGSHDFIDDTVDCPATGTSALCPTAGGGLLMHWQAVGGTALSPGQATVIRGHPDVEADVPSSQALRALHGDPILLSYPSVGAPLPEGWCGTCGQGHCLPSK